MSASFASQAPKNPKLRPALVLGISAIALFFGGFGAWAVVTPLTSAATASGQVRVQSYRKTVQHLEGGIIKEILVTEGDVVAAGDVLVRLDNLQASAMADSLRSQLTALNALEERLKAERDGRNQLLFSEDLSTRKDDPRVHAALEGQVRIFDSRRTLLNGKTALLTQRAGQLAAEADAYRSQLRAAEAQMALVNEELRTVEDLVSRGIEKRPRLMSLQRELARLEGERGEQLGLISRIEQSIGETQLQITELSNEQLNEVISELRDVQVKIDEVEDKLRTANDIAKRTDIVAPEAGRVIQLRHVTPGGVLKAGDAILDLVPRDDVFVVEARISPLDIDAVRPGLIAEIKLTSVKQRGLPIILGKVASVSADALTDEHSGVSYYTAEISLPDEQIASLEDVVLYPGMPADIMVVTGERTPFQYLVEPIRDSFRKALRED